MDWTTRAETWLIENATDLPDKVITGRGSKLTFVRNTPTAPQTDDVSLGGADRRIVDIDRRLDRLRALESSLHISPQFTIEVDQLPTYTEQAQLDGHDLWSIKEQAHEAIDRVKARRKAHWLEWVQMGKKKTGKLFRWMKNQETLSSLQKLNHGQVNPRHEH